MGRFLRVVFGSALFFVGTLGIAGETSSTAPQDTLIAEKWEKQVIPHWMTGVPGSFDPGDKTTHQYWTFKAEGASRAVAIILGTGEASEKYAELVYDLNKANYSVYLFDHRGMGRNERPLQNPQIVHVSSGQFSDYVTDAQYFLDEVFGKGPETSRFVLGHSFGGLVALRALAGDAHGVKAALLNAPLLEMDTGKMEPKKALAAASLLIRIGRGQDYAPGFSDYDPHTAKFEHQTMTNSRARFRLQQEVLKRFPEVLMAGPSVEWVREALRESSEEKIAALAELASVPTRIFLAGEDTAVKPGGIKTYCGKAKNCSISFFPKSRHEVLREVDEIRTEGVKQMLEFFGRF